MLAPFATPVRLGILEALWILGPPPAPSFIGSHP